MRIATCIALASCAARLSANAQPAAHPARFDFSALAWAARGSAVTGNGVGAGLEGRWRVPDRDWIALATSVGSTSLSDVTIPVEAGGFRTSGTVNFVAIGPELSQRLGSIRAHLAAKGGIAVVRSNSTFTPFDFTYAFDRVSSSGGYAELGVGATVSLNRQLGVEVGFRDARVSSTVWARNPLFSFDGAPAAPAIAYRRSLRTQVLLAGVRLNLK
jgi:hypothetical protein